MPKQSKGMAMKPSAKGKSKAEQSITSAIPKTPKLYSSFLPIPLLLPSPIPIPSASSSKPITTVTHYIYVRPHQTSTIIQLEEEEDDSRGRTVFIANLPVDMGERDLRTVFGRWGVVESLVIASAAGGDVLESAVKGTIAEEEETDDDDDDEDGQEGEGTGEEEGIRAEPIFIGEGGPALPRSRRPRKKPVLPTSVPEITPLPPIDPRTDSLGPSGAHTAQLTFLDASSLTRVMASSAPEAIHLPKYGTDPANPTGLVYYSSLHSAVRPSLGDVKEYADTSMARFDHLHSLLLTSRAKAKGAGALVDEDGFTVVVRGGRYGRTAGRGVPGGSGGAGFAPGSAGVGVAKKGFEKGKVAKGGAAELSDFYRFQKVDRKREELADLRRKFEHDKAKVDELKKSKRFKPY